MDAIVEEKVRFQSGSLTLSAVLGYPEDAAVQRAVLLCSPHPHFAGNMDNNVIAAIAKTFAQDSAVLRFDYRGVGQSDIELAEGVSVFDYWQEVETTKDYSDAMEDVEAALRALNENAGDSRLGVVLIGYSFGTAVAMQYGINQGQGEVFVGIAPPLGKIDFHFLAQCPKPCLLLVGRDDFLYSAGEMETLRSVVNDNVTIEVLEGCDHFFRGDEALIAQIVRNFVFKHTINRESA